MFITPGTPRIVIISYSMNYGVQKCVWTALGDITANIDLDIQKLLKRTFLRPLIYNDENINIGEIWMKIIYKFFLNFD